MNFNQSIALKNMFDLVLKDASTGEVKAQKRSYNTILETMFSRLCNFNPYFTNIQLGSGTGTVTTGLLKMFNRQIYKTVSIVETGGSAETGEFYVTKKITLDNTEGNGITFSEVGIGYGAGNSKNNSLCTLSLLDEPIAKTSDDILEVYATVFFKFINFNSNFKFINLNIPESNQLFQYFISNTKPTAVIEFGSSPAVLTNDNASNSVRGYLGEKSTTWVADVVNKSVSTAPVSLDYSDINKNIWTMALVNICRFILPCPGIGYDGYTFHDVFLEDNAGEFVIPTPEVNHLIDVKKNAITVNPNDYDIVQYLDSVGVRYDTNRDELQVKGCRAVDFHQSGNYVVCGGNRFITGNGGFVYAYSIDNTNKTLSNKIFEKFFDSDTEMRDINAVRFNGTGEYLLVGGAGVSGNNNKLLYMYKFNAINGAFQNEPLETPSIPGYYYDIKRLEFSKNDNYVVVLTNTLHIYKFNNITGMFGERLETSFPTNINDFCISSDFKYLAVALSGSNGFKVYQFDDVTETYSEITAPVGFDMPTYVSGIGFVEGGIVVVRSNSGPEYVQVYEFNDGIIGEKWTVTADMPPKSVDRVAVSYDKRMIVLSSSNTWHFYLILNGDLQKLPTTVNYPVLGGLSCEGRFDSTDSKMAVGFGLSASNLYNLQIFDLTKNRTKIIYDDYSSGDDISASYSVQHIPKSNQNRVLDISFTISFADET